MRLPFLLTVLLGVGGCTISPTTFNFADPGMANASRIILVEQQHQQRWSESSPSSSGERISLPEGIGTVEGPVNLPERSALPELPTFTEEELTNPDVVEEKLVGHIAELRNHISSYYRTLEEFEAETLERNMAE